MPNPGQQPAKSSEYKSAGVFDLVDWTVGAKVSTTINVAAQLKDCRGNAVAQITHLKAYLSDNADGSTLTATTASGGVVVGTNGVIVAAEVASKVFDIITNSAGQFDLSITQSSSHNFYLVIEGPMGNVIVSPIITF